MNNSTSGCSQVCPWWTRWLGCWRRWLGSWGSCPAWLQQSWPAWGGGGADLVQASACCRGTRPGSEGTRRFIAPARPRDCSTGDTSVCIAIQLKTLMTMTNNCDKQSWWKFETKLGQNNFCGNAWEEITRVGFVKSFISRRRKTARFPKLRQQGGSLIQEKIISPDDVSFPGLCRWEVRDGKSVHVC